ncbi:hypothetical protein E2C01_001482 [Portunus trituberculatus]|uniref:Uncharacterized protein n=1 Tax=Portunus trituberculatus TaxID=210409 RepID=A0A5B7CKJ3_PORTR|nr:hypothetical protein [Portunus trituberculatus]
MARSSTALDTPPRPRQQGIHDVVSSRLSLYHIRNDTLPAHCPSLLHSAPPPLQQHPQITATPPHTHPIRPTTKVIHQNTTTPPQHSPNTAVPANCCHQSQHCDLTLPAFLPGSLPPVPRQPACLPACLPLPE